MRIHILDHNFFAENVIASYLIENGGEPVLIEKQTLLRGDTLVNADVRFDQGSRFVEPERGL